LWCAAINDVFAPLFLRSSDDATISSYTSGSTTIQGTNGVSRTGIYSTVVRVQTQINRIGRSSNRILGEAFISSTIISSTVHFTDSHFTWHIVYRTYHWFSMKFMSVKRTVGEIVVYKSRHHINPGFIYINAVPRFIYINPVKEPQNWTIPLKFFCLSQLTNSLTAVTACNYVI
jgi:hypothetical protein